MTDRPLGLIDLDQLVQILPDLIADALRQRDTRVPPPLRGSLTKATGVVTTPGSITAEVQLDEDEPGVLSQVQLASAVDAGDRVVVFLSPGGGAVAIGNGNVQARAQSGGGTLITDSYYEFIDDGTTTGNLYTAGDVENKWDAVSGSSNGSDVSLSSGVVTIDTTGMYSIAATWDLKADTAADTYSYARGRFTLDRGNEPSSPSHGSVFLDDLKTPAVNTGDNKHMANFSCSITAFMYAGDRVIVEGRFQAAADPGSTWSFLTASMYVERLS